jgi:hypothetical protein
LGRKRDTEREKIENFSSMPRHTAAAACSCMKFFHPRIPWEKFFSNTQKLKLEFSEDQNPVGKKFIGFQCEVLISSSHWRWSVFSSKFSLGTQKQAGLRE